MKTKNKKERGKNVVTTVAYRLIVPSSNTVMEPDFHRQLDASGVVSTTRILLEDVTREAEIRMLEDDLPQAIRRSGRPRPMSSCSAAPPRSLGTLAHDDGIACAIEKETGAKAITVLRRSGASRAIRPEKSRSSRPTSRT